jgi:hypothetical protein
VRVLRGRGCWRAAARAPSVSAVFQAPSSSLVAAPAPSALCSSASASRRRAQAAGSGQVKSCQCVAAARQRSGLPPSPSCSRDHSASAVASSACTMGIWPVAPEVAAVRARSIRVAAVPAEAAVSPGRGAAVTHRHHQVPPRAGAVTAPRRSPAGADATDPVVLVTRPGNTAGQAPARRRSRCHGHFWATAGLVGPGLPAAVAFRGAGGWGRSGGRGGYRPAIPRPAGAPAAARSSSAARSWHCWAVR